MTGGPDAITVVVLGRDNCSMPVFSDPVMRIKSGDARLAHDAVSVLLLPDAAA
jgi:hydroxymethylpyrimidine/phosphomethylpyrimidine kinase